MAATAQFWEEQFNDDSNNPFDGVLVYHYEAGTTSVKDVWTDRAKTTVAEQPRAGDSHGFVWFYGDGLYRLRILDKNGALLYDWDNVNISVGSVGIEAGDCEVGMVPVYVGPGDQFECDFIDLATVRGCLPIANCGTGTDDTPSDGTLLIGNTAGGYTVGNITAGTGITVTNGNGTIAIAAGGLQAQPYGSIGQKSFVASSQNQFTLSADVVMLRHTTSGSAVRYAPSNLTNDITTAGSTANGRDAAASFSASSWVHFYWIFDPGDEDTARPENLASLSSATAPPTGPTLPTNYVYWSYAGAVRLNSSSQLTRTRIMGNKALYETHQQALTDGVATTESEVNLQSFIPPNAGYFQVCVLNKKDDDGNLSVDIGFIAGSIFHTIYSPHGDQSTNYSDVFEMPNVGQRMFYTGADENVIVDIFMQGYSLPNGGS